MQHSIEGANHHVNGSEDNWLQDQSRLVPRDALPEGQRERKTDRALQHNSEKFSSHFPGNSFKDSLNTLPGPASVMNSTREESGGNPA